MQIQSVEADWVYIPIPREKQHTSDFGHTISCDATLLRIDTECGITGRGRTAAAMPACASGGWARPDKIGERP